MSAGRLDAAANAVQNTDRITELIDRLEDRRSLTREEWTELILGRDEQTAEYLFERARETRIRHYGHDVYIRGLIEFTNYCRNDCLYCGIRKSNPNAERYRLTPDEILACCEHGYELGFRTFVLQGGEDGWFTDSRLADIVSSIHSRWQDCAITLSVGERSRESYRILRDAGADRFLLRHETYDHTHYARLHPSSLSAQERQRCLWDLKDLGYQVEEYPLSRDEIYIADEAFFCGTAAEITPIREMDHRTIGAGHAGPVTKHLQQEFFKVVRGENPKYQNWLAPYTID